MPKKITTDSLIINPYITEPTGGSGLLYTDDRGKNITLKINGDAIRPISLQDSLWENSIVRWVPTNATAGLWLGTVGAGAGTYTTVLPTGTSRYSSMKRAVYSNVATTANQVLGQRNTEPMFFKDLTSRRGGYFFAARFGFSTFTNGSRFFAGLHSSTTVISANPSSLNNTIGFCIDAADNGAISFLTRGTSATKTPTGLTAATDKGYIVTIYAVPQANGFKWGILDMDTNTEITGYATSTLPADNTMLTAGVLASNGALTPVNSIQLGINSIYIETNF